MRTRNDRPFWYCLYNDREEMTDAEGYETGEKRVSYESAVQTWANISPASGSAQMEQFGPSENYDKVILTKDMSCPIDEHSVLFLDKEPEYTPDGLPLYDYTVWRVAKSLHHIAYAVRKVNVS